MPSMYIGINISRHRLNLHPREEAQLLASPSDRGPETPKSPGLYTKHGAGSLPGPTLLSQPITRF